MDEFVSYDLDNEQQFWDGKWSHNYVVLAYTDLEIELDDIVSLSCDDYELIDNALRAYLKFTSNFKDEYLSTDWDLEQCTQKLLQSDIFEKHKDYVRRQIIYSLLQEGGAATLHVISGFLLIDGRQNEETFEMMNTEGCFPKLVELIKGGQDERLHRSLLELLYEMSRMQRLSQEDLGMVDDELVTYLLSIIESLSNDVDDPYHYPVIRVLVSLFNAL